MRKAINQKVIYLWSDLREKSYHQKYIALDYKEKLEGMGFLVRINQSRDWNNTLTEVKHLKPNLFFLHGGKIFPPDVAKTISKICPIYLRWRWHPDPPKDLMDICTIASKVAFVNNDYNGKLIYSPHPAITKYFYPHYISEKKYKSDVFFVGLAGKRGNGFYSKSNRNYILGSKYVRYLNKEMFGDGNVGFYNYEEIAKYYNSAKMVLSVSSFDDEVNFRVWNAMACRVPVISDRTPAMDRHFQAGVDYIVYDKDNIKSFDDIVKSVLDNNNHALERYARYAHTKIIFNHTSELRLKEVLIKLGMI